MLLQTDLDKTQNITAIANHSPVYLLESDDISTAIKKIVSSGHRRVPITDKNGNVVGIITYMDILNMLLRRTSLNTKISEFMTRLVIFSVPTDTILKTLQMMQISRKGGIPIIKNKKLVGIVSERDFIKHLYRSHTSISVSEIMSPKPFNISPKTSISNTIKTLINTHYRRMPIVENNEVIGIITGLDILKYIQETNFNHTYLNENIEEIMITPVLHTLEYNDLSDAIKTMIDNEVGGIMVVNEANQLKGIITERDIIEIL